MRTDIAALAFGLAFAVAAGNPAAAFQTSATAYIAVDQATGIVLAEKNADQPIPPASLSKLMTLNMVFEALDDGRLSMDDRLPVSSHAMSYKGSSMFLDRNDRVRVEDLIRGIVVLSGNDACAVVAEALSPDGTEAGFARLMTERGREIGLTGSNFTNSNGWPDPDHYMTARDLAILASHLIREFPQYYPYFAEIEFGFDERVPSNRFNRNPLLDLGIGADGLKTGYTSDAGYGLVGSAKRGNRRIVFVLSGMKGTVLRREEAERMINWYYFQFEEFVPFEVGEVVATVPVFNGKEREVPATVAQAAALPLPVAAKGAVEAFAEFTEPAFAPVVKGQPLGELVITVPGLSEPARIPLVAAADVAAGNVVDKVVNRALELIDRTVVEPVSRMQ